MKRFIITEEEKNNIRKMYGFINEQTSLPVATSSAGATASYYDGPYFSRNDWDSHDFLNTIEIASAVLGMFPTPLSPLFWGISTIAGVADAKLYFDEKDPYMGTLMMALSVIPGGELAKIFKSSKAFQKIGVEGLKKLVKSYKSGNLKKESVKYLKEFTNIFKQPSVIKEVNKGIIETSLLTLKNNLKNKSLKYLINFLIYLNKFSKGVKNITFKVGGTVFGIDKLYLIIFADNEEYPYIRASVDYRMPTPSQSWPAVGAVVTITCAARGLSFQKATDIGGKARFNLHNYYGQHRSQPSPTDIWIIRVAFRGKTQQLEYRAHPHFPYINSSFRF